MPLLRQIEGRISHQHSLFQLDGAAAIPADSWSLASFRHRIARGDPRSRLQETKKTAESLLPGGPYDLWKEGETLRRIKDLASAFAQHPHLPRMLNATDGGLKPEAAAELRKALDDISDAFHG